MILFRDIAVLASWASLTSCNPINGVAGDVISQPGYSNTPGPPPPVQLDRLSPAESPSRATTKDGGSTGQYRQYHLLLPILFLPVM